MTLRPRLALTILATALPLVAGLVWLRTELTRGSLEQGMKEFVLAHMQSGGRELCEQFPQGFPREPGPPVRRPGMGRGPGARGPGGPRPMRLHRGPRERPVRLWAYHPDFRSANPRAPDFPADLRAELEGGEETASEFTNGSIIVATRMPWSEGPCAVMLVERALEDHAAHLDILLWGLIALCGLLLAAVLLSAGPIVRRIRLLQRDVRHAAAARYAQEVEVRGGDELAGLAAAFNEAGKEVRRHITDIEARERALRGFVANTSHDMMIPLTVLQGHLATIRKRLDAGLEVEPELLHLALEEAHYMGSLMHNLSAAAKLEGGEFQVQTHPVELCGLVERVVARHEPVAAAKGVELEFAVPDQRVRTTGDITLIEQAVSNIVHNAVRYNKKGGHVSVLLESPDDRFSITVADDGPGVDDEQLRQLPERRYRGDRARSRDPSGLGLGLHIARDVADRHGFTLEFAHAEGGGLEVVLSGPLA